jgi:hypothetical protein
MPTVWMRQDPKYRTRFHRSPECYQLTKGPARGDNNDLIPIDLDDVQTRPCKTCYPDAPRMKIRHAYCTVCESPYACEHNGGLLIRDRGGRWYWTWPDSNSMPLYRRSA